MAKNKFIVIDEELKIQIKKELWDRLELYLNSDCTEKQKIAKIIKEIIDHFTQSENLITQNFRRHLGIKNLEYLLNQLLIHIDDIKNERMAIELKYLLLNYNVLLLESNNNMQLFFEKLPALENTDIVAKIMFFELKRQPHEYDYYSIIACEEINKLLQRKEFEGIDNFDFLKKVYQNYYNCLTTSYNSLDDNTNHKLSICYGTFFRLLLCFQTISPTSILNTEETEFTTFIDLLFSKLPFLNEQHLFLYNNILSDQSFLYRAKGKDDSQKILEELSLMQDLDSEKTEYIISFLKNSKNIDFIYCPSYKYFMLYFEIATTASIEDLEYIYDYMLNTVHNKPILLSEIRYLIYDIIKNNFPNISNLEAIFNNSISIYTNDMPNSSLLSYKFIEFLDIFINQIKKYSDLKESEINKLKALIGKKFKENNSNYIEFMNNYLKKEKQKSLKS